MTRTITSDGLLQALADSTAVAMENVHVHQELEEARLETLERLALSAEYRDDATFEHTQRVARTAFLVAIEVGLSTSEASLIEQAAPLHDIGKLAIPDAILLKPGKLTDAELEQIKGHAAAGAAILAGSTSEVLCLAQEIALSHHEWWDGSGYPNGLSGEAIPVSGRIVALADVFDALTHARPYKEAWTAGDAVAEVCRLRGRQFEPSVVDAFMRLDPHDPVIPGGWPHVEVAA
jgi:putative two-component system response regulator